MPGKRTALLIATDTYDDAAFRRLQAPGMDATALAKVLADQEIGEYDVEVLANRPSHEVRVRINELFTEANRDDLILLYVSGHGIKDQSGQLHLATTDTRRTVLAATGVSAYFVRDLIDYSPARKVVVWLDCCYAGAFPAGKVPKAEGTVDVLSQLGARYGRGCAVMTASTAIQFAFEGGGDAVSGTVQPSVFTSAIVDGLRTGDADLNADGEIDAAELYAYVYEKVKASTPEQTPTRNDLVTGELYIARSKRGLRLDLSLPIEIRQALRSSYAPIRFGAVIALGELVAGGDKAARGALHRLLTGPDKDLAEKADAVLLEQEQLAVAPRPSEPETFTPASTDENRMPEDTAPPVTTRATPRVAPAKITLPNPDGRRHGSTEGTTLVEVSGSAESVVFSPDGRHLACVCDSAARIWSTSSWTRIGPGSSSGDDGIDARHVTFSPDGDLLAATRRGTTTLWDTATWHKVGAIEHDATVDSLAFSPSGSVLAGASRNVIVLWNIRTRLEITSFRDYSIACVAFSPDGRVLASAGSNRTVKLWDTATWTPVRTLSDRMGPVHSVVFGSQGSFLVSADWYAVKIWDTRTWEKTTTIVEHHDGVHPIALAPAGAILATTGLHKKIQLWDARTGHVVDELTGHKGLVISMAFSPDGTVLASSDDEGAVKLWAVDPVLSVPRGKLAP